MSATGLVRCAMCWINYQAASVPLQLLVRIREVMRNSCNRFLCTMGLFDTLNVKTPMFLPDNDLWKVIRGRSWEWQLVISSYRHSRTMSSYQVGLYICTFWLRKQRLDSTRWTPCWLSVRNLRTKLNSNVCRNRRSNILAPWELDPPQDGPEHKGY